MKLSYRIIGNGAKVVWSFKGLCWVDATDCVRSIGLCYDTFFVSCVVYSSEAMMSYWQIKSSYFLAWITTNLSKSIQNCLLIVECVHE